MRRILLTVLIIFCFCLSIPGCSQAKAHSTAGLPPAETGGVTPPAASVARDAATAETTQQAPLKGTPPDGTIAPVTESRKERQLLRRDPAVGKAHVRVPILSYHSVSDRPIGLKELSVTVKRFEEQMKYLCDHEFTTITFNELKNFRAYARPVLITFDDGYEDNFTTAYPILKKYNARATVFLIAGKIGSPGYLTAEEIGAMKDLVSFQSHTVNHPNLNAIGAGWLKKELEMSRTMIGAVTKAPVTVLAYPGGEYDDNVAAAAARIYDFAVTTDHGFYKTGANAYKIKRLTIQRSCTLGTFISTVRS